MNAHVPGDDAPQRQFIFISDGRLHDTPSVRHLLRLLRPARSDHLCQDIFDRFHADEEIYALPVVDAGDKPVALVDRKRFIEFFSKPYSREIFGRRNILDFLASKESENTDAVIVEDSCTVEDAARIIIDAGMQHMVTGFVVTSHGRYLGVANGHDLLNIITQRKQAELYYLAHYDSLTGLPNRMLLNDRLEHACREADRKKALAALLFIDVDRFKQINDSLGHAAGDIVLRTIAERLKASARRADTVARMGGDEFVILMEDLDDPADANMVALRVVNSMQQPIELLGHSLVATVSVGSAIYPNDDTEMSPLLAKADAAMYEAKSNGRNGFQKYLPGTVLYNPANKLLENELRQAIERGELVLHYQPQVELMDGKVSGVEALVRWHHPERGIISPGQFIPLAEESGLIIPLGEWVLSQAFRQFQTWQKTGQPPLRISVNISAVQFRQQGFSEFLEARLAEFDVDPQLIELEMTESMLMQSAGDILRTLDEIKRLGVTLAIDDFGTGFSSLSYLRRFPIDRLKIDQSFVRDIERSPANESIARAIVALANSLSLDIVAEGIETQPERAVLEHLRCTQGQGFLFAKPMSADELDAWIAAYRKHHVVTDLFDLPIPDFLLQARAKDAGAAGSMLALDADLSSV